MLAAPRPCWVRSPSAWPLLRVRPRLQRLRRKHHRRRRQQALLLLRVIIVYCEEHLTSELHLIVPSLCKALQRAQRENEHEHVDGLV